MVGAQGVLLGALIAGQVEFIPEETIGAVADRIDQDQIRKVPKGSTEFDGGGDPLSGTANGGACPPIQIESILGKQEGGVGDMYGIRTCGCHVDKDVAIDGANGGESQ